jgi:YHS domain-containing protein
MKTLMAITLALAAGAFLLAGCGQEEQEGRTGGEGSTAPAGARKIEQKTCPVMEGNKIDPKLYADHKGRRIYFCCKSCVEAFKKDPEKYIKKVDEELAGLKAGAAAEEPKASNEQGHEGHSH